MQCFAQSKAPHLLCGIERKICIEHNIKLATERRHLDMLKLV